MSSCCRSAGRGPAWLAECPRRPQGPESLLLPHSGGSGVKGRAAADNPHQEGSFQTCDHQFQSRKIAKHFKVPTSPPDTELQLAMARSCQSNKNTTTHNHDKIVFHRQDRFADYGPSQRQITEKKSQEAPHHFFSSRIRINDSYLMSQYESYIVLHCLPLNPTVWLNSF